MRRTFVAAIAFTLSASALAETPPVKQQMPENYNEIIREYSEKAKEIANDIPAEQKDMFKDLDAQIKKQQLATCKRLAASEIPEERKAAKSCLEKLNARKSN